MTTRTKRLRKERARAPRSRALFDRVIAGAVLGIPASAIFLMLIGAEWAGGRQDWAASLEVFRIVAGSVAGGMLTGALLGPARRHMRSAIRSAAIMAALFALAAALPMAAVWIPGRFSPRGAAMYFGLTAVAGAAIGLLVRDADGVAVRQPAHDSGADRRPAIWILALVELGWMMESLPTPRNRRRNVLRHQTMRAEWIDIIRRNVPLYSRLSPDDQAALRGHVNVFLAEKRFEGCGGLEITDEIRLTIAAQACLLLLHRPHGWFPTLRTIVVYPDAYVKTSRAHAGGGIQTEEEITVLGESWRRGEVVLSWRNVVHGANNPHDGQNLVLHEFAHQLDQADGAADGIPEVRSFGAYRAWASILARRFRAHEQAIGRGRRTVMDAYGAENRAEFFAVATETFFEKPRQLRDDQPELYDVLRSYYGLDPASLARTSVTMETEEGKQA